METSSTSIAESLESNDKSIANVETFNEVLENYKFSEVKISELNEILKEKEEEISRLRAAYYHFEELHSQVEARNKASEAVMARASKWYHENKMLRRKSAMLISALQDKPDLWLNDDPNSTLDEEEDNIDSFVNDMKDKVSRAAYNQLQAEKQTESLREKLKELEKELETERFAHIITREKLEHQQDSLNRLQRVSIIAVDEFKQIQVQLDEERSNAAKAKECIDEVKRERNALARQSAILLASVATEKKLMDAAMELERLTMITEKQGKELEEKTKETEEWKCKWEKAARELQWMSEECQKLQENDKININRIHALENEIHTLQNRLETKKSSSPPPPPPPPPPLPPTQWTWNPIGALMSAIGLSRPANSKKDAAIVLPDVRKQAMDDMMQKIEKGEFRLRSIKKDSIIDISSDSGANPAIEEMRNVLSSIKKGGSMRNFNWTREPIPQASFTNSLRLTHPKYTYYINRNSKESTSTLSPELEFLLSKRRRAIDNAILIE